MARKQSRGKDLYGTKQVAEILGVPEWRVKNFSEGEAYGLPPSQKVGAGRGSRRLYSEVDIFRMAIANELLAFGFGPEDVGHALSKITDSKLVEPEGGTPEDMPILVCRGGLWLIQKMEAVHSLVENALIHRGEEFGIFILNFPSLLEGVYKRMKQTSEHPADRNPERGGKP